MAKLPDLFVNAVTTFDGKALAKGQKQISGFEKNVKNLAKAFGLTFSAAALAQYGKNAVKAFADQQLEVAQLTTAVRNLGLAFATPEIDRYIDKIEAATGVNRNLLQPSMLKLLQVTGSVTKSQELLNLAMDVSAGTGTDLAKTSEILSQAYVGNFKGLRSLNLGLTQAELASTNFEEVQKRLQVLFAGQAKVAADSYVGSMNKLAIASENASEKIGKSLVGALTALSGGETIDDTISKIDKLSSAVAGLIDVTIGLKAGEYLQQYYGLNAGKIPGGFGNRSLSAGNQDTQKADAKARAKAEADAAKRAKELLALQRKSAIAEKNKIALSKAAAIFDTTRVSLAAALKATYDKETRLRLEALMAIEEDNGDLALKKISELAALQKNADLAKLAGVKEISDSTLLAINTQLLAELKAINDSKMAEADKEILREEAFKKYNAAITAAGELAAKEQYSERVQIQLTEIARLASLSNTTSALKTEVLLRESAELSMIGRVAKAQAEADAARLKALQDYLALLAKGGAGTPGAPDTGGGNRGGGGPGSVTPASTQLATLTELRKATTVGTGINFLLKEQIDELTSNTGIASILNQSDERTRLTEMGLFDKAAKGGSFDVGSFRMAENKIDITINAGVGDPEAIARVIEDVLNQSTYRGTSVNRGSGDYTAA
jgi:hypothetical protein